MTLSRTAVHADLLNPVFTKSWMRRAWGHSDLSTDSGADTGRLCLQERLPIP